jgi:hypothetical protein
MRPDRILFALITLGDLVGGYLPTQSSYSPTVWKQPQPVHFFYGTIVAIRSAEIAYGGPAGLGAKVVKLALGEPWTRRDGWAHEQVCKDLDRVAKSWSRDRAAA